MRASALGWNNRPWLLPAEKHQTIPPIYIAVGGNTGAGKSRLIRELGAAIGAELPHVALDERETHHPFIDRLFHDPSNYAFEIQVNFMLQRCLLIKRWLDLGISLIMERSHIEDPVFARFLCDRDLITAVQLDLYMELWTELDRLTPLPDLLVLLDVEPEESIRRLHSAEASGERPKEFPDESTRVLWVKGWSNQYRRRSEELSKDPRLAGRIQVIKDAYGPQQLAATLVAQLAWRVDSH